MSLYKSSEQAMAHCLEDFREDEKPAYRMQLELADVLTGPTSGRNARDLTVRLIETNDPKEIALALIEIGTRYLKDCK